MDPTNHISRRKALQRSALGIISLSLPFSGFSHVNKQKSIPIVAGKPHPAYPSLEPDLVSEVVGKSHFDLEAVKNLVEKRPELARATWEWRFGDFESAIGAASHVGRRDIINYLLSKGATPDIFTFATLGAYEIVKGIIQLSPGIQTSSGPHGISLLSHAKVGLRMEDKMSSDEIENSKRLIAYLEELGDADGPQYMEVPESEKPKYLGDYKYGEGKDEGFSIQLNMRKMLSLGAIGEFGGALYKIRENEFTYNGAPSVSVSFQFEKEKVISMTITEPGSSLVAKKI